MRLRTAVSIAALSGAIHATAADAQQYQLALRREVDRTAAALRDSGFAPAGPLAYGTLNQAARDERPLALTAGSRYVIVGVCDQDCTGLALALADPAGAPAGAGRGTPSRPTLELSAAATGAYRLTVEMLACRQSPCYWGVQLFRK